jgi:hypothetical protein
MVINKYLKRGLLGVLIVFISGVIFSFTLWPLLVSNFVGGIGCVQSFLVNVGFIIFLIVVPFIVLMSSGFSGLIVGSLLTFVYWFLLGMLIGWVYNKIKLKNLKK